MFSLRNYIDIVEGKPINEAPVANPYTGADAEKFARLSPEDQAWYTKGGGKPDLNDPYIAARAPNKGKLGAAPAAAPAAAAAPADDRNEMDKASDAAAAANPAKPSVAQAATPAPAAGAAAGGAAAAMAAAANPATGVNAQGQNVSINNPDGSKTNSETGETTPAQAASPAPAAPAAAAAPANRDAMPFGKAFADARAKGEKEFTWKGKKYAVTMAKPAAKPAQAATPAKPLPGVAVPGGGQISDTPAAESIQMNEFDMDMDRIMKNMGGANKTLKLDPSNIQNSINDLKTGIMGKMDTMTKDITGNSNITAPGANIPNPPKEKQDPKELLKNMPDADIEKLSGDDAKVLLGQLKKLAGM